MYIALAVNYNIYSNLNYTIKFSIKFFSKNKKKKIIKLSKASYVYMTVDKDLHDSFSCFKVSCFN